MDAVDEIKGRLSVDDVVGKYVDLKRSGSSYKGLCPFHQEKTPSFYVSPSRGTYHCFGCGRGGDIFSFVMELEKLQFPEALSQLAAQAGVTLPEREARQPSLKGRLHEANAAAAHFFHQLLAGEQGVRAREYLFERGFGADAAELFELGYAPDAREALLQHLRSAGFEDRIALVAGLAVEEDIGGKMRDRFRGRLMFPIRDASGHVTGFGGRTLGDSQPKYLNSPQTEVFDKSAALFGIHRAQDAVRQAGKAVLVEGYLDAIRAHLGGFLYTVASLGTAVTTHQLLSLSRLTDTVVLALDPDPAGQAAAARTSLTALVEVTRARGRGTGAAGALDLRIARLPDGFGDPDELIRDHPDLWEKAIADSVPAFEFYFDQTMQSLDHTSESWRQEAIDRLLPIIQQFASSAGWQAIWLERLATETGIDPRALQRAIPAAQPGRRRRQRTDDRGKGVVDETTARGLAADPEIAVEQGLIELLLQVMVVPDDVAAELEGVAIKRVEHRTILDRLLAWRHNGNYDYEIFRETVPEDVHHYMDELREHGAPPPEDRKIAVAVADHLARLRHYRILSESARVSQLLKDMAPEDRTVAVADLARLMTDRLAIEQSLARLSLLKVQAITVTDADQGTIDQDAGSW